MAVARFEWMGDCQMAAIVERCDGLIEAERCRDVCAWAARVCPGPPNWLALSVEVLGDSYPGGPGSHSSSLS